MIGASYVGQEVAAVAGEYQVLVTMRSLVVSEHEWSMDASVRADVMLAGKRITFPDGSVGMIIRHTVEVDRIDVTTEREFLETRRRTHMFGTKVAMITVVGQ